MAYLFLSVGLFLGIFAQALEVTPGNKYMEGEGRLVVLRFVPGDRQAQLFVVGKKAAELNLKNEAKLLSVTWLSPEGKTENLEFTDSGESFVVKAPSQKLHPKSKIRVRAEVKGQTEEVEIPMRLKTSVRP